MTWLNSTYTKKFVGGSVQRETDRTVEVDGESLATIVNGIDQPLSIIVDIEGGEFDLIDNDLDTLVDSCSHLFIEFHRFTDNSVEEYEQQLMDKGLELLDSQEDVRVYFNPKFR